MATFVCCDGEEHCGYTFFVVVDGGCECWKSCCCTSVPIVKVDWLRYFLFVVATVATTVPYTIVTAKQKLLLATTAVTATSTSLTEDNYMTTTTVNSNVRNNPVGYGDCKICHLSATATTITPRYLCYWNMASVAATSRQQYLPPVRDKP